VQKAFAEANIFVSPALLNEYREVPLRLESEGKIEISRSRKRFGIGHDEKQPVLFFLPLVSQRRRQTFQIGLFQKMKKRYNVY